MAGYPESDERAATQARLEEIERELGELKAERDEMRAHWEREKERIQQSRELKEQIEQAKARAAHYERDGDLGKVAELRYGVIPQYEAALRAVNEELAAIERSHRMLKEEVDAEDVAEIVAKWTGIPVSRLMEGERAKLLSMERLLHERVIGQDEAVSAVCNAIRRARAGLQDARRPIGSFIFLGTTGVGKTELARALAQFLFDDERALVRIDMSEYMEKFSVSRLIGAPPGYVGYEEGGQLTEAVRRKPYSVVLLDEIEKAHLDVFNILLQVLDDGRLTDSQGRTVNFTNAIVIMTSNIGSMIIQEKLSNTPHDEIGVAVAELRPALLNLLRQNIRPEFLNRVDDIVIFKPLALEEIREIVELQLRQVTARLLEHDGIVLQVDDEAKDWLAKLGFDVAYGARPLRRTIQKYITNPLAGKILAGDFVRGDSVVASASETGEIRFTKR